MDTVVAIAPKAVLLGTTTRIGVDLQRVLKTGQTLSGTVTLSSVPGNLTLANPAVNSAEFDDDEGNPVPIGKGIEFDVSDGSAGKYQIKIIAPIAGGSLTTGGLLTLFVQDFGAR